MSLEFDWLFLAEIAVADVIGPPDGTQAGIGGHKGEVPNRARVFAVRHQSSPRFHR